MKDNTCTIHPTVRSSTLFALELLCEEKNMSLGKVIEELLIKNKDFSEKKKMY